MCFILVFLACFSSVIFPLLALTLGILFGLVPSKPFQVNTTGGGEAYLRDLSRRIDRLLLGRS